MLKYFNVLGALVAYNEENLWTVGNGILTYGSIKDNTDTMAILKENGFPIKQRIFEMKVPTKMNAVGHLAAAFYLSAIGDDKKVL